MNDQFQHALRLQKQGRFDEAEAIYRQIVAWNPEWVLGNLGVILRMTGRLEEAETVLRAALAAKPDSAAVRHTLGMTLLQLGQYAEGWRCYAARFDLRPHPEPPQGMAQWRGESLAGKRLLVIAEQGLG